MSEADASTSSGPRARTRNSPGVAADAARLFVIAATMWKACRREIESMFVGCRNLSRRERRKKTEMQSKELPMITQQAEAVNGREKQNEKKTTAAGSLRNHRLYFLAVSTPRGPTIALSHRFATRSASEPTHSLLRSAQHEQVRVACGVGIRRTTVREGGATRSE